MKNKIITCLVIGILSVLLFSNVLYSQTAQEYLKNGLALKQSGNIDGAIKMLEKAVTVDKKFAQAYYELGYLYKSKETPASLATAEEMILEARKNGFNQQKCYEALALISEDRTMYSTARDMWGKVLEKDSANTIALLGIARAYAKEADENRCRIDRPTGIITILPYAYPDPGAISVDDKNYFIYNYIKYPALFGIKTIKDFYLDKPFRLDPIRWDDFVNQLDSYAEAYNKKVLKKEPENRDALYQLGLLYFSKMVFINTAGEEDRSSNTTAQKAASTKGFDPQSPKSDVIGYVQDTLYLNKFIQLFETLVENHPDDKDGHLFLGLGHHRNGDYEQAFEEYKTASGLMSEKEREVFSDISLLRTGAFSDSAGSGRSNEDVEKYWYRRDPVYLTPYNERELEHYSRVAEANLRFSIPRLGTEGWNTLQGKIWIKYGPPKAYRKWKDTEIYESIPRGLFPPKTLDFWSYDKFSFVLETGISDEIHKYYFNVNDRFNFKDIAKDVEREYPEIYEYKPKGTFIEFPLSAAQFRGEKGKTRLEVYYGVPFNKIHFDKDEDNYYASFKTGVFIHNADWERLVGDIQEGGIEMKVSEFDTNKIATGKYDYQMPPTGSLPLYHFDFEIQDLNSDNIGFFKDSLLIERFGYDSLQISTVVPAAEISMIDSTGAMTFDNIAMEPNPRKSYSAGKPLWFYCEIYNLKRNTATGTTDYTVGYALNYKEKENLSVVDKLKQIVRLIVNKRQIQVGAQFTNRGRNSDEPLFLRLEHNLTDEGIYILQITVTDNIAHKSSKRTAEFRIANQ